MINFVKITLALITVLTLSACDKINTANRTLDTMIGGDFEVHILGHDKPYLVNNGKVTSVPEKGYYVFYPVIDGEKRMVQSPIQITTIIKKD